MKRSGAARFGAGLALALTMAVPLAVDTAHAGDAQFEQPWQFTPRDRRVAIALAIKQVEDDLLGPSRSTSTTNIENVVCNGPSGEAGATANFLCEVVKGSDIQIGDREQGSTGAQTATNNNSTNGNVNQAANESRVDGVAAALQGRF